MILQKQKLMALCCAVMAVAGSCSSGDDSLELTTKWLGPLSGFESLSGNNETGVFLSKKGSPPPAVSRILLQPAEITVSNRSDLNAISPETYEQIRGAFSTALANEMSRRLEGQENRTEGTYLVRIALTNLTATRIGRNEQRSALRDLRFSFENAAIEAELRERHTNTRHAVFLLNARSASARWVGLPEAFQKLARQIVSQILDARTEINRRANRSKPVTAPKKK